VIEEEAHPRTGKPVRGWALLHVFSAAIICSSAGFGRTYLARYYRTIILDDDCADFPGFNVCKHGLKSGSLEVRTTITVIRVPTEVGKTVLDVVVMGRFMRKESSKIPLKISSFLCLRRFKVAFFLMWYVTILLDRLSITESFLRVNPQQLFYCCTRLSVFLICIIVRAAIWRKKTVG